MVCRGSRVSSSVASRGGRPVPQRAQLFPDLASSSCGCCRQIVLTPAAASSGSTRSDRADEADVQSGGSQRHGFVDRDTAGPALYMAEVVQHDDRADGHGQAARGTRRAIAAGAVRDDSPGRCQAARRAARHYRRCTVQRRRRRPGYSRLSWNTPMRSSVCINGPCTR